MNWWWESFLALRFIVLGAALFVMGALLAYIANKDDPEISVLGVVIFVAGMSIMVLGVVVWPRTGGGVPTDEPDAAHDVGSGS
jgi:hypothetical protein